MKIIQWHKLYFIIFINIIYNNIITMNSLTNYSLDTSKNINFNILNEKISSLIKNDKMYGGSNIDYYNKYNYIIIIGILMIVIGFMIIWYNNIWIKTIANITNISCIPLDKECKISINYIVGKIQYSKIITIQKSNISKILINQIQIYYLESDPKIIKLDDMYNN